MSGKIPEEAFRVYCITDPPAAPRIFPVRDGPALSVDISGKNGENGDKEQKIVTVFSSRCHRFDKRLTGEGDILIPSRKEGRGLL